MSSSIIHKVGARMTDRYEYIVSINKAVDRRPIISEDAVCIKRKDTSAWHEFNII